MECLPLADIAIKADAYADNLNSVEGLKAALRIVAQNVRDSASSRGEQNDGVIWETKNA